jgi:toxin ParE1/3/4
MKKTVILKPAWENLYEIQDYITKKSGSVTAALKFTDQLIDKSQSIAELPFLIGKARPDLHPDLHSVVFKGYVIFFRATDDTIEIINILEGHRDFISYFDNDYTS